MAARSRLPGLNDNFRTKLRPKHQLLIQKCYPRLPKNSTADVKPNGSELSYLLYYASTRSSKLEKVGSFLERKAGADLSKSQSAQVQVTLQIVSAIVEKVYSNAGAFALIAPHGLRIIRSIISKPTDIALVQATLPTWEVFCKHQDYALQAADPEYRELFEQVAGHYAGLATKGGKGSKPNHRLRQVGLHALLSLLTANESAALDSSPQLLETLVPAILSNLRTDNPTELDTLVAELKRRKQDSEDKATERKNSASGTNTDKSDKSTDTSSEADSRAAKGTAEDADKIAEQGVALAALDTLQNFFAIGNKSHLRGATMAVLAYAGNLKRNPSNVYVSQSAAPLPERWATQIFLLLVSWTPVQDRFIVLVGAVEVLSRLPAKDADLAHNLLYTKLIYTVLSSDLNLIGLSVMDVLLSLLQKQVSVLQPEVKDQSVDRETAAARLQLGQKLKACIASLATHVYYSDQVSDMVATILAKLRPDTASTTLSATSSSADEQGVPLRHTSTTSGFSFADARRVALETVRDIIHLANSPRTNGGGVADNRNRIPMLVWENTHWLLREPSYDVRAAYAAALVAWLTHETTRNDQRLQDYPNRKLLKADTGDSPIRRAGTTASVRDKPRQKYAGSSFLSLLHLAHYESAIQYAPTSDSDVSLLYALLSSLVQHLGVNALQHGLPMAFALQDEVPKSKDQTAQIRLSCLVHGYFWTVLEVYGVQSQSVGTDILDEINKRKSNQLWVESITYPPTSSSNASGSVSTISASAAADLKLFDRRAELIDAVIQQQDAQISVANIPSSPGRNFSRPRYAQDGGVSAGGQDENSHEDGGNVAPPNLKQTLSAPWTKEACLAQAAALAPKSVSISGSRASRLVAGTPPQDWGSQSVRQSSVALKGSQPQVGLQASGIDAVVSGDQTPRRTAVGIDALRQVLVNGKPAGGQVERKVLTADSDSDSMVEVPDGDVASFNEEFSTPMEARNPITPLQENSRFMPSTEQATEAMGLQSATAAETGKKPAEIGRGSTRRKGHASMLLGRIPMDEVEKPSISIQSPPY